MPHLIANSTSRQIDRIFTYILSINQESECASNLRIISPYLNRDQFDKSLKKIEDFIKTENIALTLFKVCINFAGNLENRGELIDKSIKIAGSIKNNKRKYKIFERMSVDLNGTKVKKVIKSALNANKSDFYTIYLTPAIANLNQYSEPLVARDATDFVLDIALSTRYWGSMHFPVSKNGITYSRQAGIKMLLPYMNEENVERIITYLKYIEQDRYKVDVLEVLGQALPIDFRENLVSFVQNIEIDWQRGDAIAQLADFFIDGQIEEVFDIANEIEDENRRSRAVTSLLRRLPSKSRNEIQIIKESMNFAFGSFWLDEFIYSLRFLDEENLSDISDLLVEMRVLDLENIYEGEKEALAVLIYENGYPEYILEKAKVEKKLNWLIALFDKLEKPEKHNVLEYLVQNLKSPIASDDLTFKIAQLLLREDRFFEVFIDYIEDQIDNGKVHYASRLLKEASIMTNDERLLFMVKKLISEEVLLNEKNHIINILLNLNYYDLNNENNLKEHMMEVWVKTLDEHRALSHEAVVSLAADREFISTTVLPENLISNINKDIVELYTRWKW